MVSRYFNYKSLNLDINIKDLQFRQQVVNGLLGSYTARKNNFPIGAIKRKASPSVKHGHLPHIMPNRKRCTRCHNRESEKRPIQDFSESHVVLMYVCKVTVAASLSSKLTNIILNVLSKRVAILLPIIL